MSIRLILPALLVTLAVLAFGGGVGSTSEWGIIIGPCRWCNGTNQLEVHHIYCQHLWPERARDTNNMVCLCRADGKGCHFYIGHHGVSWAFVFTNVMEIIKAGKR
jgi:hypothetical protein